MPISIAAHASPQLSPKCNSQKQLSGGYPCIAFIYIAFPLIILYFHHLYQNISFLSLYTSQYYSTWFSSLCYIGIQDLCYICCQVQSDFLNHKPKQTGHTFSFLLEFQMLSSSLSTNMYSFLSHLQLPITQHVFE